jgi:mannosyltransferase OCH1-like enzyme
MYIPKLVFQIWIGRDENIPEYYTVSKNSIEKYMVSCGWKYIFLKTEDVVAFIRQEYPEHLAMYLGFEHDIQRADAARPLVLEKYGGLYLDMHFELTENIDRLFITKAGYDVFLLPSPNFPAYYTNAFMASLPGADLWKNYLDEMKKEVPWYALGKHLVVMHSTGPLALNRALEKSRSVVKKIKNELVAPCSVCDIGEDVAPTPGRLVRQMRGGTWHQWDSKMYDFLMCNWKELLVGILFVYVIYCAREP